MDRGQSHQDLEALLLAPALGVGEEAEEALLAYSTNLQLLHQ